MIRLGDKTRRAEKSTPVKPVKAEPKHTWIKTEPKEDCRAFKLYSGAGEGTTLPPYSTPSPSPSQEYLAHQHSFEHMQSHQMGRETFLPAPQTKPEMYPTKPIPMSLYSFSPEMSSPYTQMSFYQPNMMYNYWQQYHTITGWIQVGKIWAGVKEYLLFGDISAMEWGPPCPQTSAQKAFFQRRKISRIKKSSQKYYFLSNVPSNR